MMVLQLERSTRSVSAENFEQFVVEARADGLGLLCEIIVPAVFRPRKLKSGKHVQASK